MAAEARDEAQEHPSPDTLLAYDAGELGEEPAAGVRRHLAVCPECARTVLDLASFPEVEPAPGVVALTDSGEAASWRRILDRLAAEEAQPKAAPPRESRPARPPRAWVMPLLAAALVAVSLGLGLWVFQLYQVEEAGPGASANVHVIELTPLGGSVPRGPAEETVPAGMGSIVLELGVADLRAFSDYRMTVRRDEPGGEPWRLRGLKRQPDGHFSVLVPREFLPAGRYRIELEGVGEEGAERLAEYELTISYEDR